MVSRNLDRRSFGWDQVDPFDTTDNNFWMKAEHLGRYLFAADFLKQFQPKIVADISCGLGYGIEELSKIADAVIGVDNDEKMIEISSRRMNNLNSRFLIKDLDNENLIPDITEGSVDAIVCFETIEHLIDPNRAMSQFSRILKPEGFFICSVPNVLSESRDIAGLPRNKYHKQWFNFASLSRMVQNHEMQIVYRLGQSWSNMLFKREMQLLKAKQIGQKLSDVPAMHSSEIMRLFSYIVAYPTVEDVDGSYSIIVVAQKILDNPIR
jgi:SAM-dependent methyltransferase